MLSKLTENEVYNYLGLLFVILVVIFVIHKIVETQTKVIEGMNNKSINELIDKIKDTAKKNREDLHIGEDRSKFEDIIISYKSMIGCSVLKQISTNEDFTGLNGNAQEFYDNDSNFILKNDQQTNFITKVVGNGT